MQLSGYVLVEWLNYCHIDEPSLDDHAIWVYLACRYCCVLQSSFHAAWSTKWFHLAEKDTRDTGKSLSQTWGYFESHYVSQVQRTGLPSVWRHPDHSHTVMGILWYSVCGVLEHRGVDDVRLASGAVVGD